MFCPKCGNPLPANARFCSRFAASRFARTLRREWSRRSARRRSKRPTIPTLTTSRQILTRRRRKPPLRADRLERRRERSRLLDLERFVDAFLLHADRSRRNYFLDSNELGESSGRFRSGRAPFVDGENASDRRRGRRRTSSFAFARLDCFSDGGRSRFARSDFDERRRPKSV